MEKSSQNSARKVIGSVQRAVDILDLFNSEHAELGNSEIAKMVNLPIGTASGLVYMLKINNYLDQNPDTRKYRLGLKLAERASVLLDQLDLRKMSVPYLEDLRVWSGESINLAVRDGFSVVYIERMFGSHSLGIRSELGKRAPLHSTALGKAILACVPASELQDLLEKYRFFPVTPHTIIDRNKFECELIKVHQQGFAVDEQENEIGGRCVGAPVFDRTGYPVGAISISVPIQRFPEEQVESFGLKLRQVANKISQKMGYLGK